MFSWTFIYSIKWVKRFGYSLFAHANPSVFDSDLDCGLILLYNDAWKHLDDARFLELWSVAKQIQKNLLNSSLIKVQFFLAFSADISDL